MRKELMKLGLGLLCAGLGMSVFAAPEPMLSSALFVLNRAGAEYDDKVNVLSDMIAVRLAEKGFSVMDHQEILSRFSAYAKGDQADPTLMAKVRDLLGDDQVTGESLDSLIEGQSAKKIASLMGADYLIIATLNSVGEDVRKGVVYGQQMGTKVMTVRVALKVLDGDFGGTVAGAIVLAQDTEPLQAGVTVMNSDRLNGLLDQCAIDATQLVGAKVGRIKESPVYQAARVQVTIDCNVAGATVLIDNVAYGTTPCTISLPKGAATLSLVRQDFRPIQTFISPFAGQSINMNMELSEAGLNRWKSIEAFKLAQKGRETEIEIAREQSEADAYAKRQVAEGEKEFRKNSSVKDDGFVEGLKEIIHGN